MRHLIEEWTGDFVLVRRDPPTGTWIFIAIHDLTLGPAMGGCRLNTYATPEAGLRDAMRLAEGMTNKWATIGFDLGGGKSVLAVPGPLAGGERDGLFERFGTLIDSLGGVYSCGPDLGTTPHDMEVIRRRTVHVHGAGRVGGTIDPGPYTALGVLHGIRAAVRRVFDTEDITGRSVLIQGAGDVGYPLGIMLRDAGASVLVSDSDPDRALRLADAARGTVVPPDEVFGTVCDVYAPCAIGATLNAGSIPLLACRIVAGSANNQLAEDEDAERLHTRGILYAPDYVINAGGATALPLLGAGTHDDATVRARLETFDDILSEIFAKAAAADVSPEVEAKARVDRVLAARRSAK